MPVPTISLDENSPAGNTNISLGDNRIREYKTQNREILEVDHDYPSSSQSETAGQHKKVTLQEQADLGTGAVGTTKLGSQTVLTRGELVYTNEDDVDIVLTTGAKIGKSTQDAVFDDVTCTTLSMTSALTNSDNGFVPIGGVIAWMKSISQTPALPANFVECNGQTLSDTGSVYNGTVIPDLNTVNRFLRGSPSSGTVGGSETVTLTTTELPAHTHTVPGTAVNSGGTSGKYQEGDGSGAASNISTGSAGSGAAFSIINKYFSVVWIMRVK